MYIYIHIYIPWTCLSPILRVRLKYIFHMIHGTGRFTYMNGWFVWFELVGEYTVPVPWILWVYIYICIQIPRTHWWRYPDSSQMPTTCAVIGAIALAESLPFLPKLKVGTGEELNRHGIFFGVPGRLDIYIYTYIHMKRCKGIHLYIDMHT